MHLKVCNLSKVDTSKNRAVEFTVEVKGGVFFVAVFIVFFPLKKGDFKRTFWLRIMKLESSKDWLNFSGTSVTNSLLHFPP